MISEPGTGPLSQAQLTAAVRQVLPSARADLERLVRIPSVSADPAAAPHLWASAAEVAALLRQAGLPEVDVVTAGDSRPAVLGRRPAPPGAPTVLLYAHHDVQPPGDPADWDGDPFTPAERDGRLFGRGTADDKAGVAVHLAALRAHGDRLGVGVIVLVEGEEEIGSPALPVFLAAYAVWLGADVVVFADAGNWTADTPALTTTLRGGTSVVVEVRTLRHGVHSGLYGGPVPDALTVLCRMLATLHDERGDVAVPGLTRGSAGSGGADRLDLTEAQFRAEAGVLDGVRLTGTGGLTDRLWAGPAIAVIGIDAPSVAAASNTLIPAARAKVSLRVAPGDDAAAARAALTAHLTASAPWGVQVTVQPGAIAAPFTARTGGRAYQAARSALEQAWGRPAVDAGAGGSIPFVTAYAGLFPDAEILITGVEDPGSRAHSSNESLHLATFERACLAEALLLRDLAGQDLLSRTALLRALGSRCADTSQRSCSRPPSRSSWRASWGSACDWLACAAVADFWMARAVTVSAPRSIVQEPGAAGLDVAAAGPPPGLHRRHTAAPSRPAITRAWPSRQATDVIEVIVMTTSLGQRPASSGSRLRALGRSARTMRNLYKEQVYAWERFFRAGLPPQPGAPGSAASPRVHVPAPRPAPDANPSKLR